MFETKKMIKKMIFEVHHKETNTMPCIEYRQLKKCKKI